MTFPSAARSGVPRARLTAHARRPLRDYVAEIVADFGAQPDAGRTALGVLRAWERQIRLERSDLDPRDATALARVAVRFAADTARLRAAAESAYDSLPEAPEGVVLVVGSVARVEASAGSDIDLLVIVPSGISLPLGLQKRMTQTKERARDQAMMARPWLVHFYATLVDLGYRRGRERCLAIGADEFAPRVLRAQARDGRLLAFARYGANITLASRPLGDQFAAAAALRGLNMPSDEMMARYRSEIALIKRDSAADPHDAHSLVSQLFQALLLYANDVRLRQAAARPYWYLPWLVPLSPITAETWIEMVRLIQIARWREGNGFPADKVADYAIRPAFKRLLRDLEHRELLARGPTNELKTRVP